MQKNQLYVDKVLSKHSIKVEELYKKVDKYYGIF